MTAGKALEDGAPAEVADELVAAVVLADDVLGFVGGEGGGAVSHNDSAGAVVRNC